MVGDIFKEADWWFDFLDESFDVWPEMSWVVFSKFFSSNTKRLAGISASDAIHFSTPRFAIEGFKIRPNRRCIQSFFFHAASQDLARKGFDLDITDCSRSWLCEFKSKLDAAKS